MTPPPTLERAALQDVPEVAEVVAAAFVDLLPSQWLIPDREVRLRVFPAYFALYVELGVRHGMVHLLPDRTAAAIWLPTDPAAPGGHLDDYDARLAAICGEWVDRFHTFDQTLEANHPTIAPHHHLAILAVRPDRQRQGLGTALLRGHHAHLDAEGVPAYLEASDTGTRDLYLRHGYQPLGEPFSLPDGPPMYPMWRDPSA